MEIGKEVGGSERERKGNGRKSIAERETEGNGREDEEKSEKGKGSEAEPRRKEGKRIRKERKARGMHRERLLEHRSPSHPRIGFP